MAKSVDSIAIFNPGPAKLPKEVNLPYKQLVISRIIVTRGLVNVGSIKDSKSSR